MNTGSRRRLFSTSGKSKKLSLRPLKKRSGETRFESTLRDRLHDYNVWFVKLKPTITGFPDRLALQAPRRKCFVELKGLTGVVSDAQRQIHIQLRAMGFRVIVLQKGKVTVERAVELIRNELYESTR
jgi:hypothetical protein